MENRRCITEEDLLITEALIAQSYGQLKQSVVQVPSRAYRSLGQTAREHPYATAGTAVVAGVVLYGIIKKMTSHTSVQETPVKEQVPHQKDTCRPDPMHDMLLMLIPLVTPYITSYIQKYLGEMQSGKRD
ncbi:MAG: hypothetical protein WC626_01575 [Methanoregula sp.]